MEAHHMVGPVDDNQIIPERVAGGQDAGGADAFLAHIAEILAEQGVKLAGVVQANDPHTDGGRCDMSLIELSSGAEIRLSQNLGAAARGCSLDPAGLVRASALIAQALARDGVELLIINKFGKQEASGKGLRDVLAEAMMAGIPVLAGVSRLNLAACQDFAGDCFCPLPLERGSILAWCDTYRRGPRQDA